MPSLTPAGPVRRVSNTPAEFVPRSPCWDGYVGFTLLNCSRNISSPADWNAFDAAKLWLYLLHYFDDLARPDAARLRESHSQLIRRWIDENPPIAGNGWEPYPLSLRICNWIRWSLSGGDLQTDMRNSLAVQLRQLANSLEYHLLGNHLWANAKALYFGGLYFEGAEAERWKSLGMRLLGQELAEQILADGGHFERSPTYHALILEDLLDIMNLARSYDHHLPAAWQGAAERMLDWLSVMTRPDGTYVLWNDAADGTAPSLAALHAYASRLGICRQPLHGAAVRYLEDTGYVRVDTAGGTLWFDVGPVGPDYIPGHAHADTLNIELFARGRSVLVDTGVSTYEAGRRRDYERGTAAHNTVIVDNADSCELWGSFRVGRRARPHSIFVDAAMLAAAHDGYAYRGIDCSRRIAIEENRIRIVDRVARRHGTGKATAHFHLAPGLFATVEGTEVRAGTTRFQFAGARQVRLEHRELAAGFNVLKPAICIAVDFDDELSSMVTI
jgi:uncharacterized heparinase superfamily protein